MLGDKLGGFLEPWGGDRLQRGVSRAFVQGDSVGVGVPGLRVCLCMCVSVWRHSRDHLVFPRGEWESADLVTLADALASTARPP